METSGNSTNPPEVNFGGLDAAQYLWDYGHGCDLEYGMLAWKGQRYWFTFASYDEAEEAVRYSVFALTAEESAILDDWHILHQFIMNQWRLLANDPVKSNSLALKEKTKQAEAFAASRPRFESSPVVAQFSHSDHG